MKVASYRSIRGHEEAPGAVMRTAIGAADGAPRFALRVFEIAAGASTPFHSHWWEHEVYVISGRGSVRGKDGEHALKAGDVLYIAPREEHCLANAGKTKLRFVCVIPLLREDEMVTGYNHSSFTVGDLERSIAFYQMLGFKVDRRAEREGAAIEQVVGIPGAHLLIAHLLLGDFDLELIQYVAPKGVKLDTSPNNVGAAHVAFWTRDLMKSYTELKARGVRFKGTVTEGGPKGVYFLDPDGNALELSERR